MISLCLLSLKPIFIDLSPSKDDIIWHRGLTCSTVQFHVVLLWINNFPSFELGRLCSLLDSIIEQLML